VLIKLLAPLAMLREAMPVAEETAPPVGNR